ncbi:MAG: aminopeptidase P family protein, partial [Thermoplasmata archaeon]|nr:aminopeptidase P family protein [Thermoplasmata archaeon]
MEPRVKRLFENIEKEMDEVPDAVVIANATDPHLDYTFFYVTRLEVGRFEGSVAVLYPDGELHVITSLLEAESASKGDFNLHVFKTIDELNEIVDDLLKNAKKIGINGDELTYKMYNFIKKHAIDNSELIDISKFIKLTRMVKDEAEIKTLRKACEIASEVAELMIDFIEPGMIEYKVAAEMSYEMQKRGAIGPSFETIMAFGKNSAEPHYSAGEAVLEKGQFVLMDFGAVYKRYCSDITRTYFCGPISDKQRKIYETVAEAQRLALDTIKVGVPCSEPHIVAAEYINSTEFKDLFTHGLGHGLGLAVHDGGGLNPRAEDIIMEDGMVFTVEPGIYIPGFGGVRIEDDIVVRKDGPELLTTARKDIIE